MCYEKDAPAELNITDEISVIDYLIVNFRLSSRFSDQIDFKNATAYGIFLILIKVNRFNSDTCSVNNINGEIAILQIL